MRVAAGLIIVFCFVLIAILAPAITPHSPLAISSEASTPPFWQRGGALSNPLGTDRLGRDVWSRLVYGARNSLIVAAGALAIGGVLGTTLGFASGYWRGSRDRIFDLALPRLISPVVWLVCCLWIAIVLLASVGSGLTNLIIVIGLVTWLRYVKPIRGEVMRPLTSGLRCSGDGGGGASDSRSIVRYWLPRAVGALPALFISQVGFLIILESIISFLGIGVAPPTPSWGSMIADTRNSLTSWWVWAPPVLCIFLTVSGFYMLGNWLRDRSKNSRAAS